MFSHGASPAARMPVILRLIPRPGKFPFAGADYANPQDADQNNAYEVTIRATDYQRAHMRSRQFRVAIEYPFDEANGDAVPGGWAWLPGTRFDGNASDMSGNGNDGTLYGHGARN